MIILVAAEKGGVGKTSVAVNLAALAVSDGIDTLLLDTDSTGSAGAWIRIRKDENVTPAIPVLTITDADPISTLADIAPKYDLVIVDVGARSYDTMLKMALLADLMVVPTTPGQFEAESTLNLMDVLRSMDVRHRSGRIPVHVVLNQLPTNSRSREESDLREFLRESGIPVLSSALRTRKAWRDASKSGRGLHELSRSDFDPKAADEARNVYAELESLAGGGKSAQKPLQKPTIGRKKSVAQAPKAKARVSTKPVPTKAAVKKAAPKTRTATKPKAAAKAVRSRTGKGAR